MKRSEITAAIAELTSAIEKSGILQALRSGLRTEKTGAGELTDVPGQFRAFRDYAIAASGFSEPTRSLASIFQIEPLEDVSRKVNRATAAKALSRCVRTLLLHVQTVTSLIHDWAAMMGLSLIRHVQGRNQSRKNARHKPHPSQAYKRAA